MPGGGFTPIPPRTRNALLSKCVGLTKNTDDGPFASRVYGGGTPIRAFISGTQISCPWFRDGVADSDDDEYVLKEPKWGAFYRYDMDPASNYIVFLVNVFENYMDVVNHHSAMLHIFFTCMHTHKGVTRRPHLIMWGDAANSKSFLMELASQIFCEGMLLGRSHTSDQFIFGEAENRVSFLLRKKHSVRAFGLMTDTACVNDLRSFRIR